MSALVLNLKRGDTLPLAGTLTVREQSVDVTSQTDFSAWRISCQVRSGQTSADTLLGEATLAFIDGTSSFAGSVPASVTAAFPVGTAYLDLRFIDGDGVVSSTQTIKLDVMEPVSEPPA